MEWHGMACFRRHLILSPSPLLPPCRPKVSAHKEGEKQRFPCRQKDRQTDRHDFAVTMQRGPTAPVIVFLPLCPSPSQLATLGQLSR
mmetsp:Transcript_35561/g.102169  ORF Transcript_35561/g.102169 Transcript_35561/m.102169 type:complete len:87 (-) Transcript_35561:86-346(-)